MTQLACFGVTSLHLQGEKGESRGHSEAFYRSHSLRAKWEGWPKMTKPEKKAMMPLRTHGCDRREGRDKARGGDWLWKDAEAHLKYSDLILGKQKA